MLKLISQGTSRYVYDMGNGLIKKIPKNKRGIWQNESEIRIYNSNKDNEIIFPLEEYDENAEWVVQKKCNPLSGNTVYLFKEIYGFEWKELCELVHSVRRKLRKKRKEGIEITKSYNGVCKFLHNFEKYLIDNDINFFEDFSHPCNWGYFEGKIYLIDYGMDSITYKKYINRT